jgi:hypothetical protein
MRIHRRALIAGVFSLSAFAPIVRAQGDTVRIGDRVRVRIVSTPGTVNVVTGNVASLSTDTLTVGLPGARGTVVMPRLGIAQLAVSDGVQSRSSQLTRTAPFLMTLPFSLALATRPTQSTNLRLLNYGFIAAETYAVARILSLPRLERWRSVTSWLDGR